MDLDQHPVVVRTRRLADQLLAAQAAQVDAGRVPRSHLDALGAAGVLGMHAPRRLGGLELPAPVIRRVVELLAGADLSTWFVQAQHHYPVRLLSGYPGFDDTTRALATGSQVSGIAFSHLRRWPQRPVRATRNGDGWRFDGVAPWYTGWGLNDVLVLCGADADGTVVQALVPAVDAGGLTGSPPIRVAALQAAVTVTLRLDGLQVGPGQVIRTEPIGDWLAQDALTTVNVNPAVFGVIESAVRLLREVDDRMAQPEAAALAGRIEEQAGGLRARAYRLLDDVPAGEQADQRLDARARAHRLMIEATTGLVVAGAGGAMAVTAPAQRKAREAMFLLVQAQTRQARVTALDHWGR